MSQRTFSMASGLKMGAVGGQRRGLSMQKPSRHTSLGLRYRSSFLSAQVTSKSRNAGRVNRLGGLLVTAGLFEKFTEKAIKVLLKSQNAVKHMGHKEV